MTHPQTELQSSYSDVVDLDRYPIDRLDSDRGRVVLAEARQALRTCGACTLPGFITPDAIDKMIDIALSLDEKAHRSDTMHTVYNDEPDTSLGEDHPKAVQLRSAKSGIAYDYIPSSVPMRRVYESDEMTQFIAAILEKPALYRSADPFDAFQITLMYPGDELTWHFDRSEFSITIMYQEAESGGDFDYLLGLRSESNENYAGVKRVLDGDESSAIRLHTPPGTLAVFRGEHSMHRVTPVQGHRPRINSVLSYGERPDMKLNSVTSQRIYGRTAV